MRTLTGRINWKGIGWMVLVLGGLTLASACVCRWIMGCL